VLSLVVFALPILLCRKPPELQADAEAFPVLCWEETWLFAALLSAGELCLRWLLQDGLADLCTTFWM